MQNILNMLQAFQKSATVSSTPAWFTIVYLPLNMFQLILAIALQVKTGLFSSQNACCNLSISHLPHSACAPFSVPFIFLGYLNSSSSRSNILYSMKPSLTLSIDSNNKPPLNSHSTLFSFVKSSTTI